jgi:hypothetical protein
VAVRYGKNRRTFKVLFMAKTDVLYSQTVAIKYAENRCTVWPQITVTIRHQPKTGVLYRYAENRPANFIASNRG